MKLKQYLRENKIRQKVFAAELCIGEAHLSQIVNDLNRPSLKLALLIKEKTNGSVTPEDYCIDCNRAA